MNNDVFYRYAPFIQEYIYRHKWEDLRDVQARAAEVIFYTDDNLLLSSGTASGKTEAAFLPALTHLYENPSSSVGILYVSPLKALINDQFERLTGLLEESYIPVTKWHGDASASDKKKVIKKPEGVIQITPESLESMLMRNKSGAYRLFSDLRFVIIDEVHFLLDSDRGLQLLCCLARLARIIGYHPRRIGLSATMGDVTLASKWLSIDTDRRCSAPVTPDKGRRLRLSVKYFPIKEKIKNSDSTALLSDYYDYLYESTAEKRCILFGNSKGEVEENIAHLKKIAEKNGGRGCYLVHHASISPALREFTEKKMRDSEIPVCTGATVTLELGIDLGNLERIVQTGTPLTVSGFVQRLGRTGRRNGISEMRFAFKYDESLPSKEFYKDVNWDLLMCIAQILLYTGEKWIEPINMPKLPYSLLYHQTMSHIFSFGEISPKELAKYILTLGVFRHVSKEDYLALLRRLLENGQLERGAGGGLHIGEKGESAVNNYDFLAVFSVPEEFSVRCGSEEIGTVQTPFKPKSQFALAGRAWETTELDLKEHMIYVKEISGISSNMWQDSGSEYVHTRVMKKIRDIIRSDEEYGFLDEKAKKRLREIRSACRRAAAGELGSVMTVTPSMFAVFPFLGTRGIMALVYALREKGFDASAYVMGYIPVCVEVKTDLGAEELRAALYDIKMNGADKYNFKIPENAEIAGKYNEYIPRELLMKQYVEDYLDTEDMRKNMEEP